MNSVSEFQKIWNEARPLTENCPATSYLAKRGLKLNEITSLSNLRYHPDLFFNNMNGVHSFKHALIAQVIVEDTLVAIQRIYLTDDCKKINPPKILGSYSGGHIEFGDEPIETLHICEGIETSLAIHTSLQQTVWSVVSAGNLSKVVIPKTVKTIHIWADKDVSKTGENEAEKAANIFQKLGCEVFIHLPKDEITKGAKSIDWLDVFNKYGPIAIQDSLKNQLSIDFELPENLICLSDIHEEEVEWLYKPFFPKGKVVMMEGDPGIGKSWISLKWAAEISSGQKLFGQQEVKPQNVLLLCSEDGLEDTIKPRLNFVEGDHSKIYANKAPLILNDEGKIKFEEIVRIVKPAIVIIDPLVAVLGGDVDMNRDNEVRVGMGFLIDIAAKYKCSILCVRHLVKSEKSKALYRGIGSIGFTAACRSVLHVGKNPNKENAGAIFHIKSNLASTGEPIGYEIVDNKFMWTGKSDLKISETMTDATNDENKSRLDEATEFLKELLANGPMRANDIYEESEKSGISKRTIERSKKLLKIEAFRENNCSKWRLPSQLRQNPYMENLAELDGANGSNYNSWSASIDENNTKDNVNDF